MYVWSRLVPLAALLALAAGCAAARPTHTQVITPRDAAIARYRRANEGAIPSVLSQLGDKDMRVALRSGASNGGDPFLLSEREAGLEDTRADLGRIEIPLGSPYASDPEMADLLLEQQVLGELVAEETARLASERDLAEHAVDLLVASQLYVDKSPMVEDPDALLAWRIAIVKDALKPNTISRYERAELAGWLRDIAPGAWSGSDRTQKRGPKTTTAAAAMEKHLASIPVAPYPTRTEEEVDRGVKAFLGIPGSFDAVEPYAERASGVLRAQLEIAFGVLSPSAADDVRRRAIALLAHPPPCAPHYPVASARHLAPPPERARACALVRALAIATNDGDELAALLALHEAVVTAGRSAAMHGKTRDPAAAARRWPRLLALPEPDDARETSFAANHPIAAMAPASAAGVLVSSGAVRGRERAREWMRFGEARLDVVDRHLAVMPRQRPLSAPGGGSPPVQRR